jgi:cytochrome c oxidase subunit II
VLVPVPAATLVNTRHQYDAVATVYGAIAIGVFILVVGMIALTVFRYRGREGGTPPSDVHDAPRLEFLYVLTLVCVATFLVAFTFVHESKTDAALRPHAGLVVRVTAAKWHWSFFYPAYGVSELGTDTSRPTLFVPADTNIDFRLTSVDVIHAFWVPIVRFKRAAYPDLTQDFTLSFAQPGFVANAGECAEFCGLLHAEMRFNVNVMSPRRFQQWVSAQPHSA